MLPIIISLGLYCEVREMVRTLYQQRISSGVDAAKVAHLRGNNFFDWNITEVWSVVSCLNDDFENVFRKSSLVASTETDGHINYVIDTASGIKFQHTFSRANGITTQSIIEDEYEEKLSKIEYLISKFRNLSKVEDHIYFIRRGQESPSETRALLYALRSFRRGRPFSLVHVTFEEFYWDEADKFPEYMNYFLPHGPWEISRWMPVFDIIQAKSLAY